MSSPEFLSLFGSHLYDPTTKVTLASADALVNKAHVLLYFSAHWCPPCRRFTPLLMEFYKKLVAKNTDCELIFCSLDNSLEEYQEYVANMPWKCVPYQTPQGDSTQDLRNKLAMKFGANGIPHLVVVDATNGNIITADGTEEVQMDPEGARFPWKPKAFNEIWPQQYLTKNNGLVDSSTLDDKHLMLYFSAHWCPPCRAFTPKLSAAYTKLKELHGDKFELVFVSSDRDENAFDEYHGEMTFGALPFAEREAKQALSKRFGIQGIPSLLILGPLDKATGERSLINDSLRGVIESGDFTDFPFYPKPFQELSVDADGINENRCLIVFCENQDDEEQADIVQVVQQAAARRQEPAMKFFYATQTGGAVGPVRKALKIENKMDGPILALVDIPDNGGYYISMPQEDITTDLITKFLTAPGERQQMGE